MSTTMIEALQGVKPLRAMALEGRLIAVIDRSVNALRRASKRAAMATQALEAFKEPITAIFVGVGIAVGHGDARAIGDGDAVGRARDLGGKRE
jgi:ABC-type bacteriocin/lantibiotic exporter with double-glycine peptidase domain